MPWLKALLLATTIAFVPAHAADRIVQNAEADIHRFEQQARGLTSSRKSQINRISKLLELSHDRLKSAKDQQTPEWQAVNRRYNDLKARLDALLQSSGATPAPAVATNKPGESMATASSAPRPLVSGERVRVKKLTRDMTHSRASLVTTGPSAFQDPDIVAQRSKGLKQFAAALERYPQLDDPDVQAARQAFGELKTALETEFKRAREQLAQLGDVQQRLATLQKNFSQYPVPAPLAIPFSEEQARGWVKAASNARTVAEHNRKQLTQIAPLAYLPNNPGTPETGAPFDGGDLERMQRYAAEMLHKVQAGYESMSQTLGQRMADIDRDVLNRYRKDPPGEASYQFIGEGSLKEAMKLFDDARAVPESVIALESALNRDTAQGTEMLARLERAREDFLQKRQTALNNSRLPEPGSENPQRLAIAEQILSNPKYEFGRHGRIVLTTAEIVSRERKDSEIEFDKAESFGGKVTLSGTETTWTYRWEEFTFAVPLKEAGGDDWYIWWITAKKYSSGGSRTPLNRWVSGEAHKGNQILAAQVQ